jgi:hypothetical protein
LFNICLEDKYWTKLRQNLDKEGKTWFRRVPNTSKFYKNRHDLEQVTSLMAIAAVHVTVPPQAPSTILARCSRLLGPPGTFVPCPINVAGQLVAEYARVQTNAADAVGSGASIRTGPYGNRLNFMVQIFALASANLLEHGVLLIPYHTHPVQWSVSPAKINQSSRVKHTIALKQRLVII